MKTTTCWVCMTSLSTVVNKSKIEIQYGMVELMLLFLLSPLNFLVFHHWGIVGKHESANFVRQKLLSPNKNFWVQWFSVSLSSFCSSRRPVFDTTQIKVHSRRINSIIYNNITKNNNSNHYVSNIEVLWLHWVLLHPTALFLAHLSVWFIVMAMVASHWDGGNTDPCHPRTSQCNNHCPKAKQSWIVDGFNDNNTK